MMPPTGLQAGPLNKHFNDVRHNVLNRFVTATRFSLNLNQQDTVLLVFLFNEKNVCTTI